MSKRQGAEVPVVNPRTGQADYVIYSPGREEIGAACKRLREAQKVWADTSLDNRLKIMSRWADTIEKRKHDIGQALAADTGRWRPSMDRVADVIQMIRGWCRKAPDVVSAAHSVGLSTTMPGVRLHQQLKPYALLGVISPWNFPLVLSLIDAIPALIAGSAAIIKPSSVTPRFVQPLSETIKAIPELDAVLAYITGTGACGQDIIDNADIVCFTGSVNTGCNVAKSCAGRLIPAFLELGGKDPVIVTAGADIQRAATAVLRGAVYASGQICHSIERIYVDQRIHDRFVDCLVEKAEKVTLNCFDIHAGHLGPIIYAPQADIIDKQLDEAVAKGASIRTGGKSLSYGGVWIRPTVVTHVSHDMELMREETFGPVMPVMAYETVDQAVALANDTVYGLSGSVIAESADKGMEIAKHIDAGGISVMDTNLTGAIFLDAEKHSFKLSGIGGSRMGDASMLRFFRKKAMMVNTGEPADLLDLC